MIIPAYTPPGDDSDLDDGWEGAQDEDDESDFEECDAHPDQAHDPSISNKTAEVGRVLPVSCGTKFPDSKRLHNALSSNLSSILASNASTGGKHKTDKNEETGETSRSTTAGSTSSGTKSGKKNSGSMSNRTHDLEWWSVIVGLIILLNL